MYPKAILSHSIFFGERFHCNFGEVAFILGVAPTASCAAEQSFSVLQRPKTDLRNTMGQDRLSHLALLCIKRAYINRVNFQPIFRPKDVSDFFWIL